MKNVLFVLLVAFSFVSGVWSGTSDQNVVALKEYFLTIIKAHEAREELRYQLVEKALMLQAIEVERRFEATNKLREEYTSDRTVFLRRDTWDAWTKERAKWQEEVNQSITRIETRSTVYMTIIGFIFLALNIAMRWIPRGEKNERNNLPPKA